jgi:16S rRNA processing protein RimM
VKADQPADLIPVGRIAGTHGVRGQVRLHSYSGNLESLSVANAVILQKPDGTRISVRLKRVSPNSSKILLSISGIETIEQAQPLVGSELCLTRDQFPATDDNEYYWCDLLGLDVSTDTGLELGKLVDILETGANDVYVVKGIDREYMIPAIATVIKDIDLSKSRMIITPMEGLLDL